MKRWYVADIGSWEKGKVVWCKEKSLSSALKRFNRMCDRLGAEYGECPDVVQVSVRADKPQGRRYHGQVIWDYMNGSF